MTIVVGMDDGQVYDSYIGPHPEDESLLFEITFEQCCASLVSISHSGAANGLLGGAFFIPTPPIKPPRERQNRLENAWKWVHITRK